MTAYTAWAGATAILLAMLTWAIVRVWGHRMRDEVTREQALQAELQAAREAAAAARQEAEAQRMILLHEVNHRARNALTVAQAVVRLSQADEPGRGDEISARIAALAAAHDLLAENNWTGARMGEIAARTLAPFAGPAVVLDGPPVAIDAAAVQPLSMILHELGTNAAKYGALSAHGRVRVEWRATEAALELRWTETGGPKLAGAPARQGLGTRLLTALVETQLGGQIMPDWRQEGLAVHLTLPAATVLAAADQPAVQAR